MDVINPVFLFTDLTSTEINRSMDKDFFTMIYISVIIVM